jgi:cyclophilin family peptidyl-prolyl cis-trans isomerase
MPIKKILLITSLVIGLFALAACSNNPSTSSTTSTSATSSSPKAKTYSSPPTMSIDKSKSYTATIKTNYGDIVVQLLPQEAPLTVNNFVFLAREGFYNGVVFHRILKGFVIQSGDPKGTGMGDPGYKFADESVTRNYVYGTLAMANSGPNTNGSQFFITLGNVTLQKSYTIFGLVTNGLDVVTKIGNLPVKASAGGELSQPTVDVHIITITIEEK